MDLSLAPARIAPSPATAPGATSSTMQAEDLTPRTLDVAQSSTARPAPSSTAGAHGAGATCTSRMGAESPELSLPTIPSDDKSGGGKDGERMTKFAPAPAPLVRMRTHASISPLRTGTAVRALARSNTMSRPTFSRSMTSRFHAAPSPDGSSRAGSPSRLGGAGRSASFLLSGRRSRKVKGASEEFKRQAAQVAAQLKQRDQDKVFVIDPRNGRSAARTPLCSCGLRRGCGLAVAVAAWRGVCGCVRLELLRGVGSAHWSVCPAPHRRRIGRLILMGLCDDGRPPLHSYDHPVRAWLPPSPRLCRRVVYHQSGPRYHLHHRYGLAGDDDATCAHGSVHAPLCACL